MDWNVWLNTLENTLEQIDVKGRENHDYLVGCFIAIDKAREALAMEQQMKQNKGGEDDGRQADIGLNASYTDKE